MNKDIISYSLILLGSFFFLAMTLNMPVTSVTVINSALFPRLVLCGIIGLSVLGLFSTIRSGKRERAEGIKAPLYLCLALLIGFVVLLHFAGFLLAASLFIAVFAAYMEGSYRPKILAMLLAGGFGVALAIDFIFTNVLSFILP